MAGPNQNRIAFGKPQDFNGSLKRLLGEMANFRVGLIVVIVFIILSTFFTALGPKVLGMATNVITEGAFAGKGMDFNTLGKLSLTLVGVYALAAGTRYLANYTITGISQKTIYNLRKQVDAKIDRLPLKYFDGTAFGDILSRVTNDVDTVSSALQEGIFMAVNSVFSVIMIFVMMLSVSPVLTLVAMVTLPITLFCSMKIVKISQKYFSGQQKYMGDLNAHVEEIYSAHNVVKAYNMEEKVEAEFAAINDNLYENTWKAQFISGSLMPVVDFIGNTGYVIIAVVGALKVIGGTLQVGDIQAFIQYLRQFNMPINQLANISLMIQSALAAAERIFQVLDETEEMPEVQNPIEIEHPKGEVILQNVKFGYASDKILIQNLNLHVNPGQKIAIVGPTGAGKTTLVNLLLRFYDINSGEILMDGVNIANMSREDLRKLYGMVLQDTWLFKGTIKENIRYGRLDATDEEIIAASKSAHAHRFIRQLPGGYDFELHEDALNISQGQRQLLTIARAILSDPKVLILDEATSSVDTRTELLIQNGMNNLMEDRTSFVIAHRLSTIRDADTILVMRDGDIVEKGNHNTLLEQKGFYAELYNSQYQQENAG